jgi:hypothetical protein
VHLHPVYDCGRDDGDVSGSEYMTTACMQVATTTGFDKTKMAPSRMTIVTNDTLKYKRAPNLPMTKDKITKTLLHQMFLYM